VLCFATVEELEPGSARTAALTESAGQGSVAPAASIATDEHGEQPNETTSLEGEELTQASEEPARPFGKPPDVVLLLPFFIRSHSLGPSIHAQTTWRSGRRPKLSCLPEAASWIHISVTTLRERLVNAVELTLYFVSV
jgi:hypothetical protein